MRSERAQLMGIARDLDSLILRMKSAKLKGFLTTTLARPHVVFFDIGNTLLLPPAAGDTRWGWATSAREAVLNLRTRGTTVGLISNTGTLSRADMADLFPVGFFDLFDSEAVVLSSEVGVTKPDFGIFYLALARTEAPPQSCVFVGENRVEVIAAQQVAMGAFRIANPVDDFPFLTSLFV